MRRPWRSTWNWAELDRSTLSSHAAAVPISIQPTEGIIPDIQSQMTNLHALSVMCGPAVGVMPAASQVDVSPHTNSEDAEENDCPAVPSYPIQARKLLGCMSSSTPLQRLHVA